MRLAVSTAYWPVAWPSPRPVTLTLYTGSSRLELPVRPPRPEDERLRPFEPPEAAVGPATIDLVAVGPQRRVEKDLTSDLTVYRAAFDMDADGRVAVSRLEEIGLEVGHGIEERFTIRGDDPLSATAEIVQRSVHRRESWAAEVETRLRLWADEVDFHIEGELLTFLNGERRFARRWNRRIPRRLV